MRALTEAEKQERDRKEQIAWWDKRVTSSQRAITKKESERFDVLLKNESETQRVNRECEDRLLKNDFEKRRIARECSDRLNRLDAEVAALKQVADQVIKDRLSFVRGDSSL